MKTEKMKVLLYLKKSGLDKSGRAPIMGRITIERSIAQFSCKLSCNPDLWNSRESRMDGNTAILCRITIDGKSTAITTGEECQPSLRVEC